MRASPASPGAGASALAWSATYERARSYRIELEPTATGLRIKF